jgi:hypothetical protein
MWPCSTPLAPAQLTGYSPCHAVISFLIYDMAPARFWWCPTFLPFPRHQSPSDHVVRPVLMVDKFLSIASEQALVAHSNMRKGYDRHPGTCPEGKTRDLPDIRSCNHKVVVSGKPQRPLPPCGSHYPVLEGTLLSCNVNGNRAGIYVLFYFILHISMAMR